MIAKDREAVLPVALEEATTLGRIAEKCAESRGEDKAVLANDIHERLDHLVSSLLEGFPDEAVTVSDVRPVLEQHFDLTPDGLHKVREALIPLVIVRELVSRHKLVVNHPEIPNWSRFVERFRAVAYA